MSFTLHDSRFAPEESGTAFKESATMSPLGYLARNYLSVQQWMFAL